MVMMRILTAQLMPTSARGAGGLSRSLTFAIEKRRRSSKMAYYKSTSRSCTIYSLHGSCRIFITIPLDAPSRLHFPSTSSSFLWAPLPCLSVAAPKSPGACVPLPTDIVHQRSPEHVSSERKAASTREQPRTDTTKSQPRNGGERHTGCMREHLKPPAKRDWHVNRKRHNK